MNIHNFNKSLEYEKSKFEVQNRFYIDRFKVDKIRRIGYEKEEDKELQKEDVDLILKRNNREVKVSEKRRSVDYNDILIEFYSKFPKVKGWISHSKADYLAYFTPKKMYWIDMCDLIKFYSTNFQPIIMENYFQNLIDNNLKKSTKSRIKFEINGKLESVSLVQAYNVTDNNDWYTLNLCISVDILKRNSVKIKEYIYDFNN